MIDVVSFSSNGHLHLGNDFGCPAGGQDPQITPTTTVSIGSTGSYAMH